MPSILSENNLMYVAILGMAGSMALGLLPVGRRLARRALDVFVLFCIVAALSVSSVKAATWPLQTGPALVAASTAAAILWFLSCREVELSKAEDLLFRTSMIGLLIWGAVRSSSSPPTSVAQAGSFVARLLLAVACGAFLEAGSLDLGRLLARQGVQADGRRTVFWGLTALTACLALVTGLGMYASGAYWSWNALQSWGLLLWLFYAALWYTSMSSARATRRVRALSAAGMILTLLLLRAVGG